MLEQPLKIRDFHRDDLGTLHDIDRICFPEGIAFSRDELLFSLNHPEGITRVAEAQGRVAGFVLVRLETRRQAHVITLDVVPEVRRCGIGSLLMEDVHEIMKRRKVGISILEVGKSNLAARRLYERLKYRHVDTLSGYYNRCEDAFRMVRIFD